MKLNKIAISYLLLFFLVNQGWTASALSSLGFGTPQTVANVRSAGMGMVSLSIPDTLGMNLISPAAWSGGKTARFGFSGNMRSLTIEDNLNSDSNDEAGLTSLGFALPVGDGRFFGITLSPYTRMDYKWATEVDSELGDSNIRQEGSGGISQVMVAWSTDFKYNLRLGLSVRPIFGKIDWHWQQAFDDNAALSSSISTSDRFKGVGFGFSSQWDNRQGITAGIAILSPVNVGVRRQTVIFASEFAQVDIEEKLAEDYDLPWDIAIGAGQLLGTHRIGFETGWQGWGSVEHPADLTANFKDSFRFGLGWEWSPEYELLDPIWRSFTYRSGVYSRDHYSLSGSGNQSRRIALTAGISIPYFANRSRIDFAFEIGWEGNKDKDGVAERSIGFAIGFNHSQEWFVARRKRN